MTDQDLEQTVAKKIEGFATLPAGWHFGDGIGAVAAAVQSAHAVKSLLADYGARNIEVFPCIDGGILVHGYGRCDTLEIQCDPDGEIHLLHERDGDLVEDQESISIGSIDKYLGDLAWLPISSFEFSTQSTTALSWAATPAPPSSRLHHVLGFPFSTHSVGSIVAVPSAVIFKISMEGMVEVPLSFGGSAPTFYQ